MRGNAEPKSVRRLANFGEACLAERKALKDRNLKSVFVAPRWDWEALDTLCLFCQARNLFCPNCCRSSDGKNITEKACHNEFRSGCLPKPDGIS